MERVSLKIRSKKDLLLSVPFIVVVAAQRGVQGQGAGPFIYMWGLSSWLTEKPAFQLCHLMAQRGEGTDVSSHKDPDPPRGRGPLLRPIQPEFLPYSRDSCTGVGLCVRIWVRLDWFSRHSISPLSSRCCWPPFLWRGTPRGRLSL